jgi:glycosyltransferase involved in cell wall biosynthesis
MWIEGLVPDYFQQDACAWFPAHEGIAIMGRGVFVAWARLSRRTRDLARELDLELLFIPDRPPYLKAWRTTERLLKEKEPDTVIVQLPQGPLLWKAVRLAERYEFKVVADTHRGFWSYSSFKELILNAPFRRFLHRADLILIHSPLIAAKARRIGLPEDKVALVYDPIPKPPPRLERPAIADRLGSYIVVPASWAADEPLEELARAFLASRSSRSYQVVITGEPRRAPRKARKLRRLAEMSRGTIILSGYLEDSMYAWLLQHSEAIISITADDYSMPAVAWEAVAYRKPLLASDIATMREVMGSGYPCFLPRSTDLRAVAEAMDSCILNITELRDSIVKTLEKLESMSISTLSILKEKLDILSRS